MPHVLRADVDRRRPGRAAARRRRARPPTCTARARAQARGRGARDDDAAPAGDQASRAGPVLRVTAPSSPRPRSPGCPVFPASNPWNQRVDALPVHPRSDAIVRSIGARRRPSIPTSAPAATRAARSASRTRSSRATPSARRCASSTPTSPTAGPYPIPRQPRIEGGGDRHMLMVQRGTCRLFELFAAAAARRRLARRQRRDLQPALEQAAPARLDERRRRRPADLPRPRPLRRGRARARSATRCASRSRARGARSSSPRATSRRR